MFIQFLLNHNKAIATQIIFEKEKDMQDRIGQNRTG